MKPCVKVLSILVITIFVHAAHVHADTVVLKNGDRLIGIIQDSHFALQSAYGQIVIKSDFLKRISLSENQPLDAKFQTINNDMLSGILLNKDIQIQLQNETRATLNINDLKLIMLDTSGPSRPLLTAVFTMNNNDRFSGKLFDSGLMIEADVMTATYRPEELNRIEFIGDGQQEVKVLLTNGDIFEGALKLDDIKIAPDSFGRLIANKSGFSSIQFNARKMVLKEFASLSAYEKDSATILTWTMTAFWIPWIDARKHQKQLKLIKMAAGKGRKFYLILTVIRLNLNTTPRWKVSSLY